jgi:hypothetical protein
MRTRTDHLACERSGLSDKHVVKALVLFVMLLAFVCAPQPAHAAPLHAIEVTGMQLDYVFAQQALFTLDARGDSAIVRAVLFVQQDSAAPLGFEAAITPGATIHAEVVQDLRGGAIQPFNTVTYWWELSAENGEQLASERRSFEYIDNRFGDWQTASREGVRVLWVEDGVFAPGELGEAALGIALEALPRISDEIGVAAPGSIDIYLYPSQADLIGALRLGGRDWAAGQARPELGVALVDVPPTGDARVQMRRLIPHELTHLLIYVATQPNYDNVPAWLDEGLAMLYEASPDPAFRVALDAALRDNRLIPLEALCAPFSSDAGEALLSYAQSGSVVQFIRDHFGFAGVRGLLAAYRENATCAAGVERALRVSLVELEDGWRGQFLLEESEAVNAVVNSSLPWLALIGVSCLALLPLLGGLAKRKA